MDGLRVLANGFRYLHEVLLADIDGLDAAMTWTQPAAGVNHVGFLFWHIVRDEDDVISYVRGERQLWESEGWHTRFGMDAKGQGTGFDPGGVASFRYDLPEFMRYAEAVWRRTERELPQLPAERLTAPAWGEWDVERLLNEGCLGHSWLHLGELRYAKGMQGWRAAE